MSYSKYHLSSGRSSSKSSRTWFSDLFGFVESKSAVRSQTELLRTRTMASDTNENCSEKKNDDDDDDDDEQQDGRFLRSKVTGDVFQHGTLEIVTLAELKSRAEALRKAGGVGDHGGRLTLRELVADVKELHRDPRNENAFFQVASQFNLLEMISPAATPNDGITIYENDLTQGPACAMSCAAGTLYRNWYRQSTGRQIDCLRRVEKQLGAGRGYYWTMVNGYALLTGESMSEEELIQCSAADQLQIGIHHDTEVTLGRGRYRGRRSRHQGKLGSASVKNKDKQDEGSHDDGHVVTQAFCSALPISYSRGVHARQVEALARMVLNASYEATLAAATSHAARTGNSKVFLTLIGGGVFGNPISWIVDAIDRAAELYADVGLDVCIVSYGERNRSLSRLLYKWEKRQKSIVVERDDDSPQNNHNEDDDHDVKESGLQGETSRSNRKRHFQLDDLENEGG